MAFLWALKRDQRAAVAPTVALALTALIGVGGLAFDYAHMATLDTELQDAADQAALAAATQLDGGSDAINRATAAARNLVKNKALLANDGADRTVSIPTLTFYTDYDQSTDSYGSVTTVPANAKVVRVAVGGRSAGFALTPVIGLVTSGPMNAEAVASVGNAICKTPPVMLCNPDEPTSNTDENLPFTAVRGVGLRLITGNATVPGNFGWLEAGIANGSNALAGSLGYNSPPGDCQPTTGVTTKTGMDTSVLKAFNTRFDVYANGNTTCPSQFGGTCSPSPNTRKDVVCDPNSTKTSCKTDTWSESSKPYHPTTAAALPAGGASEPNIMGYPKDLCQALPRSTVLASSCAVKGNGTWDRDAYFRVNYGYATAAAWQTATGLSATASRFDVYQWEFAHPTVNNGGKSYGINIPQVNGSEAAFSYPATGRASVAASTSQADRRRISVAVLNCQALGVHGKTSNAPVPTWLDIFLVEPAVDRQDKAAGKTVYTDNKDVYVEIIGVTTASSANAGQVVRRNKPYLIR